MNPLTIAIGNYGLTQALKEGRTTGRLRLEPIEVSPIAGAMRRMVRNLEFDISEMAITTYLCAKAYGKPFTAIPVFLTRNFHHWAAFHHVKAGIREPKDLEGRTVGVNRGYTVTTGIWIRGVLQHEYGVDLDTITWAATDDEHVTEFRAPPNVSYAHKGKALGELLASGALEAAVGDVRVDSPDVKPLIADAREAGFGYFRKTGIYPINHAVVIKDEVLKEAPWVAEELFGAFAAAKAEYLTRLQAGKELSAADEAAIAVGKVVGDPFPFGIEANRPALEAVMQYAVEQRVIPEKMQVEQLFAPGTL